MCKVSIVPRYPYGVAWTTWDTFRRVAYACHVSTPRYCLFDTAIGRCAVAWTDRGIASIQLPAEDDAATTKRLLAHVPEAALGKPTGETKRAVEDIRKHLQGK